MSDPDEPYDVLKAAEQDSQRPEATGMPMPRTMQSVMDDMFAALDRGESVADFMRNEERKAGHTVVLPGSEPWLPLEDWDASIIVSRQGREIRLVAILAKKPGSGALTRTLAGIKSAGLIPVFVAPTHEMRRTLKRWGWRQRLVGSTFEDREEQWLPKRVK